MKWEAVVFDMDDTLYPERDYVFSGFRAVAQWAKNKLALDEALTYKELHSLYMQGIRGNTFNIWLEQNGLDAAYLSDCIEIYRSHSPNITPFPEIPELLSKLMNTTKLGLISDGYIDVQRKKWQVLGLESYFDTVTFSDQWGREFWKPHPKPFVHTQKTLDVRQIVYIGDNPTKDFYGARQCGWGTVWLKHDQAEYAARIPPGKDYEADATIRSLTALEETLRMMAG